MANHSIVSDAEYVESIKCTSIGILHDAPAFNHSDTTMQKKIPDLIELISGWLSTFFRHIYPRNANLGKILYILTQTYYLAVPKDLSTLVSTTRIL